ARARSGRRQHSGQLHRAGIDAVRRKSDRGDPAHAPSAGADPLAQARAEAGGPRRRNAVSLLPAERLHDRSDGLGRRRAKFSLIATMRRALYPLLALLALCLAPAAASSQTIRLKTSYSSITANNSPVWIAKDKGLFAKNRLDAQMVLIESGTTSIQALVA